MSLDNFVKGIRKRTGKIARVITLSSILYGLACSNSGRQDADTGYVDGGNHSSPFPDGGNRADGGAIADGGILMGEEGGPCYPNHTCNEWLSCYSNLCVQIPADGGSLSDGGTFPDGGALLDGGSLYDGGNIADGGQPINDGGPIIDGGSNYADGGPIADGGVRSDGGVRDGGPAPDGGSPYDGRNIADGGPLSDGGPLPDSGIISLASDGGSIEDGGSAADGGSLSDGGADAGICLDDILEFNNSFGTARLLDPDTYPDLKICPNNEDWYRISVSAGDTLEVKINFINANGDINLRLYNSTETLLASSETKNDCEIITNVSDNSTFRYIKVYGAQNEINNDYTMTITRTAAPDAGLPTDAGIPEDGGLVDGGIIEDGGMIPTDGGMGCDGGNCCTINSLKGYWNFNELDGTIAYDSSGNGNNGEIFGGAIRIAGIVGNALNFDGSDDRVRIPYHSSLSLGSESFSISFWMNGGVNKQGIMNSFQNGKGLCIQTDGVGMDVIFCDDLSVCTNASFNPLLGDWHHYAIIFDREKGTVNRYLDASHSGEEIALTSRPFSHTSNFIIGDKFTAPSNYTGKLDEIKIYSCALSPDLILQEFERR